MITKVNIIFGICSMILLIVLLSLDVPFEGFLGPLLGLICLWITFYRIERKMREQRGKNEAENQ